MNPQKPGIMTTEFWSQLVAQAINLLVGLNLLSPADVPSVETTISKIVGAIILICTNAVVVIHYVDGRISLKKSNGSPPSSPVPTPAIGMIAVIIAMLLFTTSASAWPPKINWTPWRTKTAAQIEDLRQKAVEHDAKIGDHDQKLLNLRADAPKQPPTDAPQRLSTWEPALFRPEVVIVPEVFPLIRTEK